MTIAEVMAVLDVTALPDRLVGTAGRVASLSHTSAPIDVVTAQPGCGEEN